MHGDHPNKTFTGQLIDCRQLRGIQGVLLECKLTMDCQHGIAGGGEKILCIREVFLIKE